MAFADAYAGLGLTQRIRQGAPGALVVHRLPETPRRPRLAHLGDTRVARRDRVAIDLGQEVADPLHALVDRRPERAVTLRDAVGDVAAGRELETACLPLGELGIRQVGWHDAVEDEAAHPLGEEAGIRRAEEGAIRLAEVVELSVAEGGPQDVHVPGRVGGGQVW